MKRKIDKIKNKRLVMGGGINNLSPNEILVEQKGDTISLKERVNGEVKEVSGSGSSNESGGSNIEYLDVSGTSPLVKASVVQYAVYVKGLLEAYDAKTAGATLFAFSQMSDKPMEAISAIAIDFAVENIMDMGGDLISMTVADAVLQNGATQAEIDAIPRLTKEQFYSLD